MPLLESYPHASLGLTLWQSKVIASCRDPKAELRCPRTSGLTLIEVVVSLALAGTLLASAVLATGRHLQQLNRAEQSRKANVILDQFLSQWSISSFSDQGLASSLKAIDGISDAFEIQIAAVKNAPMPDSEVLRIMVLRRSDLGVRGQAPYRESPVSAWAEIIRSRQSKGS